MTELRDFSDADLLSLLTEYVNNPDCFIKYTLPDGIITNSLVLLKSKGSLTKLLTTHPRAVVTLEYKPVPDFIDWSQVASKYICMASQANTTILCTDYMYLHKPKDQDTEWQWRSHFSAAEYVDASVYSSFVRGTIKPELSLQIRGQNSK